MGPGDAAAESTIDPTSSEVIARWAKRTLVVGTPRKRAGGISNRFNMAAFRLVTGKNSFVASNLYVAQNDGWTKSTDDMSVHARLHQEGTNATRDGAKAVGLPRPGTGRSANCKRWETIIT